MGSRAIFALALATLAGACASSHPPAPPVHPAPPALQQDLDAILNDPSLSRGTWGVMVKSLQTGETLFARNERKLLMPASNMKIVTLAAAADRLGWDYTYTTRLVAAGRIDNGILAGDLVAIGSGDPSIGLIDGSAERLFDDWAARLRQLGVRTIAGRVVGDDDAFEDQELGFGWSWDDLAEDYAAGVGALQYNESAVHIRVAPGPHPGDAAAIVAEPAGGVDIVNNVSTTAAGSTTSLDARRLPGSQRLRIRGTVAIGTSPALVVSVDNPTLYFVQALRTALIARGIDIRGPAVDVDDVGDKPAPGGTLVDAHRSPPLSVLAVRMMKISQNQYAEIFLKSLSASDRSAATALGGRAVEEELFGRWGVRPGGLIIRDGSGLSRYDYVSAEALISILAHVYDDPRLRAPFEASLPVIGLDGTLGNRMKGTPAEHNARAKSGSMSNVRTLSGYVTTADGEPLAFSILANNFETGADVINKATDAIVVRLASHKR